MNKATKFWQPVQSGTWTNLSFVHPDEKMATMNQTERGLRRQKLHKNQNNIGNDKNPPEYKSMDGEDLE